MAGSAHGRSGHVTPHVGGEDEAQGERRAQGHAAQRDRGPRPRWAPGPACGGRSPQGLRPRRAVTLRHAGRVCHGVCAPRGPPEAPAEPGLRVCCTRVVGPARETDPPVNHGNPASTEGLRGGRPVPRRHGGPATRATGPPGSGEGALGVPSGRGSVLGRGRGQGPGWSTGGGAWRDRATLAAEPQPTQGQREARSFSADVGTSLVRSLSGRHEDTPGRPRRRGLQAQGKGVSHGAGDAELESVCSANHGARAGRKRPQRTRQTRDPHPKLLKPNTPNASGVM